MEVSSMLSLTGYAMMTKYKQSLTTHRHQSVEI